jgi:hypothetical protein
MLKLSISIFRVVPVTLMGLMQPKGDRDNSKDGNRQL